MPPISQVGFSSALRIHDQGTDLTVLPQSLIYAVPSIPLASLAVEQHGAMHIHNNINLSSDSQITL